MRVDKNDIFLNPASYFDLPDIKRLYISENLEKQIGVFFEDNKNEAALRKIAKELGIKEMNLCVLLPGGYTSISRCAGNELDAKIWLKGDLVEDFTSTIKDDDLLFTGSSSSKMEFAKWHFLLIIFLQYVDIERKELNPKEKFKPQKYNSIKNNSNVKFTVADVNWSFDVQINSPFAVSGHYRLQRYGPGREKLRMIYIDAFEKSGYHRKSGKEKFEEDL